MLTQLTQFRFITVFVETLGAVGDEAMAFLQYLDHRIREVTGEPKTLMSLWQMLNEAVQQGNAACVLAQNSGLTQKLRG